MLDREKQRELMKGAERHAAGYRNAWRDRPEYRAALKRYDYLVVPPECKSAMG